MTHARTRRLFLVSIAATAFGCVQQMDPVEGLGSDMPSDPAVASVSLALTTVPSGVSCLRLNHEVGMKKVESKVSVMSGANALVTFPGLAPGPCLLRLEAFSQSCGNVSATTLPTWVSDPVMAALQPGEDANIDFVLKPAAGVKGSIDFISMTLTPGGVPFGAILVGSVTPPVAFTVKNIGTGTTGTLTVALAGNNPADFGIVGNTCPATLAADATCSVQVRFAPVTPGSKTAQLSVAASPGGTVTSALSGLAQTPAQLLISPTTQNFFVGGFSGSDDRVLIVGNGGTQNTGPIAILISGPDASNFSLPFGGCTPIAGGGTCSLTVRFTQPLGGFGQQHATLTVSSMPGGVATAQLIGD